MNFFPRYTDKAIIDRISLLAQYASGAYTSQDSDFLTFIMLSDDIYDKFENRNLWQLKLIEALCTVNR